VAYDTSHEAKPTLSKTQDAQTDYKENMNKNTGSNDHALWMPQSCILHQIKLESRYIVYRKS